MWVKICGNTNLEDAVRAAELGADAVGFVFARSPRQVTAAQVGAITPHLPAGVGRVGVFDSTDAEEIAAAVQVAGLTAVQLHGGLDDGLLERLAKRFGGEIGLIQVLHWQVSGGATASSEEEHLARQIVQVADVSRKTGVAIRVLVDSKVGSAVGGTGVPFDWEAASSVFAGMPDGLRLIAAGGLRPSNVSEAIRRLRPWGVDVSSGVEASPGSKDPVLVAEFIERARG